jgi:hypothetical protein
MKTAGVRNASITGTITLVFLLGWGFSVYYNHKSLYDIRIFNDTKSIVEVVEIGGTCDGRIAPGKFLEPDCTIYEPDKWPVSLRSPSSMESYELYLAHVVEDYNGLPDETKPVVINASEFINRGQKIKNDKTKE